MQKEDQFAIQDIFDDIVQAPIDPILGTRVLFNADPDQRKINLGVGAYRDNDGKPYVFKVVEKVEKEILSKNLNHEYLQIDGLPAFVSGARNLMFHPTSQAVISERIVSVQSISGTGAVNLGLEFLAKFFPRTVYISDPTWPIHKGIAEKVGLKWKQYPYYASKTKSLDFEGMIGTLSKCQPGSIVILHACAHNPTGIDPSQEQWKIIAKICQQNKIIPFFDSAYQGYASGDLSTDAWPVRYFLSQGLQLFAAQSFSKNLGLYGQRVGALHIVVKNKTVAQKILSQLKVIIRTIYSNPNRYGVQIAAQILNNRELFFEWQLELKQVVAKRIKEMRALIRKELENIGTPGTWDHITDQIGMFSYTGLSPKVCEILTSKYHIYLMKTGRISISGINTRNISYLAQSIKSAILQAQQAKL